MCRAALSFLTLLLCASVAWAAESAPARQDTARPAIPGRLGMVILVGFDGFRWDTIDRYPTPNLRSLAAAGVRAAMRPRFPSLTNPNFYSIVTGLNPEHHGIVSNGMYDPVLSEDFTYRSWNDSRWWGGEPIWATLQQQGGIAGVTSWLGAEAGDGVRSPLYTMSYTPFAAAMSYDQRLAEVFRQIDLPAGVRPNLVTLYHDDVDNLAQDFGVGSPEERQAVFLHDAMIGKLVDGLRDRKLLDKVNIVVVADHGMVNSGADQTIYIDDFADPDTYRAGPATFGAVMNVWPIGVTQAELKSRLQKMGPHVKVYAREDIPARFHNSHHRRTPPLLVVADEGWKICRRNDPRCVGFRALHGYDNNLVSMRATFIAAGPDFKAGQSIDLVDNVSVYPLLSHLLRINPARTDGDICQFSSGLRANISC